MGGISAVSGSGALPLQTVGGSGASAAGGSSSGGFASALGNALDSLNQLENGASAAAQGLAQGSNADLSVAVISAEKANLALSLAVEVRNRAIASYQQLMQMQV